MSWRLIQTCCVDTSCLNQVIFHIQLHFPSFILLPVQQRQFVPSVCSIRVPTGHGQLEKVGEFDWSGKGQGKTFFDKSGKMKNWCSQIFRLKCIKFDFRWGSAPDPAGGAYSAPPDSLAALNSAP